MKLVTKSLAAMAVLALGHSAMADTNVYLTGSTAFRTATMNILASPGAIFDASPAPTEAYVGSSANGATIATFRGNIGGVVTNIKCSWTGSAGGVYTVANTGTGPTAQFLSDTFNTTVGTVASPTFENHACEIAMSDAFQISTFFPTPIILNDNIIGVVPFKWVGNYSMASNLGGSTPVTNITSQHLKALFGGARMISVAQLVGTNNATDLGSFVLAVGRDFDSGTRITGFADSGNGTTTSPNHWQPFMSPTTANWIGTDGAGHADGPVLTDTTITSVRKWNAGSPYTLYGGSLTVQPQDGGFSSGGDVAKMLRSDTNNATLKTALNGGILASVGYGATPATNVFMLSILGFSDANTALAAHVPGTTFGSGACKELTYNGVAYSTANIQRGTYSCWGYEHVMFGNLDGAAGPKTAAANAIVNGLASDTTNFAGAGINLDTNFLVGRGSDGSGITAGYY